MGLPNDSYFYRYRGCYSPTKKLVTILHQTAIEQFGGLAGLRDAGALPSALYVPIESAGGEDAYSSFFAKLAAMGYRFAKNHPFNDAKRTAWGLVENTLHKNDYDPGRPSVELEDVMVLRAAGRLDIAGFRAFLLIACNQDYPDERL